MRLIEAKFIGKDPELKTGERYVIELYSNCANIQLNGTKRKYLCPYQSIAAFFNNWTDVKKIKL